MRLDEINDHGEESFYQAVGAELASQLGCEIHLKDISVRDGRSSSKNRTIHYNGRNELGEFIIQLSQHWEFDQSPTKPTMRLTVMNTDGFYDQAINLGRVAIWRDDPADLAKILNYHDSLSQSIDDLFE